MSEDSIGAGRDTLVFSDVSLSPETLDASGAELSLWRGGGRWLGAVREAEGELGDSRPLRSVILDPATGRISLTDSTRDGRASPFAGTFACSRIEGTWSLFGGTTAARVVLARVPYSGFVVRDTAARVAEVSAAAQEFWSEFRRAALAGDSKKIGGWTRFPLRTHTTAGFGAQPRDGFNRFFSEVMRSAITPAGGQSEATLALLEKTERILPAHFSPDGEAFRVGALQFDLIGDDWRLTAVDLARE